MHARLRTLLKLLAAGTAILIALLAAFDRAVHHVPGFYTRRTAAGSGRPPRGGVELERQLLALHDQARTASDWQVVLSEDQINDWLAFELPAKFSGLLPREFEEPRVALEPNRVLVAGRSVGGPVAAVVTLRLTIGLADEPNTLAVRFESLRAGLIPLPRQRIVDALAHSATRADVPLRWAQAGGDPVALITLGTLHLPAEGKEAEGKDVVLEHLDIERGEVRVAGRSASPGVRPPEGGAR